MLYRRAQSALAACASPEKNYVSFSLFVAVIRNLTDRVRERDTSDDADLAEHTYNL